MTTLLLSCEHGGHRVPAAYRDLFAGAGAVLRSHRGWDPGALLLARALSRRLSAPLHEATTTRLLVDLNRSVHHPRIFSDFTRGLLPDERERLLARHYHPFRLRFAEAVEEGLVRGPVIHLSIHSFTPVLGGRERAVDVGLLYDPAHGAEKRLCAAWVRGLRQRLPDLRVRRNAPYRGATDGHCTALRRRHPEAMYRGVEIEVSQRLLSLPRVRRRVAEALATTLRLAEPLP